MSYKKPWEYEPRLTEEHLLIVAELILSARHKALELYDDSSGDTGWSYGCRAFDWCRKSITEESMSGQQHWLSVIDPNLKFIFSIGGVPVRFYRGDPENPKDKNLLETYPELNQPQFPFPGISGNEKLRWRFAVETFETGEVQNITVVGFSSEGVAECLWRIPLNEMTPIIRIVGTEFDEGIDLPEPEVVVPFIRKRTSDDNED